MIQKLLFESFSFGMIHALIPIICIIAVGVSGMRDKGWFLKPFLEDKRIIHIGKLVYIGVLGDYTLWACSPHILIREIATVFSVFFSIFVSVAHFSSSLFGLLFSEIQRELILPFSFEKIEVALLTKDLTKGNSVGSLCARRDVR